MEPAGKVALTQYVMSFSLSKCQATEQTSSIRVIGVNEEIATCVQKRSATDYKVTAKLYFGLDSSDRPQSVSETGAFYVQRYGFVEHAAIIDGWRYSPPVAGAAWG